jgi:hypothetical protein
MLTFESRVSSFKDARLIKPDIEYSALLYSASIHNCHLTVHQPLWSQLRDSSLSQLSWQLLDADINAWTEYICN